VRSGFADPTGIKQQGLSVLIVGDSSAAGVGVATQDHALAAQIASHLALKIRRSVRWRLVAKTGTTADSAIKLVTKESLEPTDVLIFCLGTNDVLSQTHPRQFIRTYRRLVEELSAEVGARFVVINGLPPMHILTAVPQPLRWYLGRYARRLDVDLRRWTSLEPNVRYVSLQWAAVAADLATDGFHPGRGQYQQWASLLADSVGVWWTANLQSYPINRASDQLPSTGQSEKPHLHDARCKRLAPNIAER
jgi:lysophospholipase L1-like esterase